MALEELLFEDVGYEAAYDRRGAGGTALGIVSRKWPLGLCLGLPKSSVN